MGLGRDGIGGRGGTLLRAGSISPSSPISMEESSPAVVAFALATLVALVVACLGSAFVSGGVLAVVLNRARGAGEANGLPLPGGPGTVMARFFEAGGRFFWRNLGLMAVTGIAFAVVGGILYGGATGGHPPAGELLVRGGRVDGRVPAARCRRAGAARGGTGARLRPAGARRRRPTRSGPGVACRGRVRGARSSWRRSGFGWRSPCSLRWPPGSMCRFAARCRLEPGGRSLDARAPAGVHGVANDDARRPRCWTGAPGHRASHARARRRAATGGACRRGGRFQDAPALEPARRRPGRSRTRRPRTGAASGARSGGSRAGTDGEVRGKWTAPSGESAGGWRPTRRPSSCRGRREAGGGRSASRLMVAWRRPSPARSAIAAKAFAN